MLTQSQIVEVAIPVPLRKTFDYLLTSPMNTEPGCRVIVPFGKTTKIGIILKIKDKSSLNRDSMKSVTEVIDRIPVLSKHQLELVSWAANYFQHPLGDAIGSAIPKLLRDGKRIEELSEKVLVKTTKTPTLSEISSRAHQQKTLLEALNDNALTKQQLAELSIQTPTIKKFTDNQWAKWIEKPTDMTHFSEQAISSPLTLNAEQAVALAAINNNDNGCFLLDGVTGSGKTEVYLQAIEKILLNQQQVLVVVPEIGLTPQTVERFKKRFNTSVGVWHSGMTDKQRLNTWYHCFIGQHRIVISTRSGIFLPLNRLGMIIIDEEHDSSFKQQEGFKYHCRSVALYRAHLLKIPAILGSATPSFETLYNAQKGKYHYLPLTKRATGTVLPKIRLIDLTISKQKYNLAESLIENVKRTLDNGYQAMLFINRRGFAPVIMCEECHWVSNCHRCSSFATYHKGKKALICHHCGDQQPVYHQCNSCGSTRLIPVGTGTEQIEHHVTELFPDTPIIRLDRDKTSNKGQFEQAIEQINSEQPAIIIGTQMVAKGHHFNKITLVGILDVDGVLYSSDFRATEKLAQLMTQVSGRAGRSGTKGEVYLQTRFPEHPVIQDLVSNSYADIANYGLSERETLCLPPYSHMALLRAETFIEQDAINWLSALLPLVSQYKELTILGPSPAPLSKKAGKFRYTLMLQCQSRTYLHNIVNWLTQHLDSVQKSNKLRWSIDIDPVDFS